jgi:uncharacterized protein YgbK (DUF1537 family)
MNDNGLLLAYYGDDFTGSTDAMEILERAGVRTVLFIGPPNAGDLAAFPDIGAYGIAGMTRAMPPETMEQTLRPAFETLKRSGARHVHYKVCSTFDSSPTIGSIGKAIDVGMEVFASRFVSMVVAAPSLGRYCTFGNLFARMGIGSNGSIHRLDRHPSMSKHPVTPADESDLLLHLAKQTQKQSNLIDILQIEAEASLSAQVLENKIAQGAEVVLFDALYEHQMPRVGALIDHYGNAGAPHFSVGSSGVEMALTGIWQQQNLIEKPASWLDPGHSAPMLVVSGSCSPVTARQIDWAVANGFTELALDTPGIANGTNDPSFEIEIKKVIQLIEAGKSVIIHTSKSTQDERFARSNTILRQKGLNETEIQGMTAELYGNALGRIARGVVAETKIKRIVIAGGDTSGVVARALGIRAVEMIAPISPGAPLCRAFAPGSPADTLEVNFKGGQVGSEDYFGSVMRGRL